MKIMNNKRNKKGFTLVELIVVLIILAILATLLIPTLTGYIDKAKEKDLIFKTRQAVQASQTLVNEAYANKAVDGYVGIEGDGSTQPDITYQEIADLAEVSRDNIVKVQIGSGGTSKTNTGKVTKVIYKDNGKYCRYTHGATNAHEVSAMQLK